MRESIFSRNVRDHLRKRKWTQADLAERLGVSQPAVGKYLSGDVKLSSIERVAAVFGVDPGALISPQGSAMVVSLEGDVVEVDVTALDPLEAALIAQIRTAPKRHDIIGLCLRVAQHFAAYQREMRRTGADPDLYPNTFNDD